MSGINNLSEADMPIYPSILEDPSAYGRCNTNCNIVPSFDYMITKASADINPSDIEQPYIVINPDYTEKKRNKIFFKNKEYELDKIVLFFSPQHRINNLQNVEAEIHIEFASYGTIASYAKRVVLGIPVITGSDNSIASDFIGKITSEITSKNPKNIQVMYPNGINMDSLLPKSNYYFYQPNSIKEYFEILGSSRKRATPLRKTKNKNFYMLVYEKPISLDSSIIEVLRKLRRIKITPNDNSEVRGKIYYSSNEFGAQIRTNDNDLLIPMGNGYQIHCEHSGNDDTTESDNKDDPFKLDLLDDDDDEEGKGSINRVTVIVCIIPILLLIFFILAQTSGLIENTFKFEKSMQSAVSFGSLVYCIVMITFLLIGVFNDSSYTIAALSMGVVGLGGLGLYLMFKKLIKKNA